MTKILTSKCAIPSKCGEFKEGQVDFDIIRSVAMDVDVYNFIDVALRKYKMGRLWDEMINKEKSKSDRTDELQGVGDDNDEDEEQEQMKAKQALDEEEDDETKKVDGIWPIKIGPDGIPLRRNNSDVMQNFFISFVVRSFTELDEILLDLQNNGEQRRIQRFAKEIKSRKEKWNTDIVDQFNACSDVYNDFVRKDLNTIFRFNKVGKSQIDSSAASHYDQDDLRQQLDSD